MRTERASPRGAQANAPPWGNREAEGAHLDRHLAERQLPTERYPLERPGETRMRKRKKKGTKPAGANQFPHPRNYGTRRLMATGEADVGPATPLAIQGLIRRGLTTKAEAKKALSAFNGVAAVYQVQKDRTVVFRPWFELDLED